MRLLVLSDSHGHNERLSLAVEQAKPDVILHLGDLIDDARNLQKEYPNIEFYMVKGNCDENSAGDKEQLLTLDGVKIFMAHGHIYKVKSSLIAYAHRAREVNADIALYGHTHRASVQQAHGIWFINPGQMERNDIIRASYGIVDVDGGNISIKLKELA